MSDKIVFRHAGIADARTNEFQRQAAPVFQKPVASGAALRWVHPPPEDEMSNLMTRIARRVDRRWLLGRDVDGCRSGLPASLAMLTNGSPTVCPISSTSTGTGEAARTDEDDGSDGALVPVR